MTQSLKASLIVFVGVLYLISCTKKDPSFYDGPGKKPVYISTTAYYDIKSLPPQPIVESGAIFLQDSLFFIVEAGQGLHVFDIKDSVNTVNLVFLNIPAIRDFVINGQYLYADSWTDLVIIDIADLYNIKEVGRNKGVLTPSLFPPLYQGYFECVDKSRGPVGGWIDAELTDARCFTVE